MLTNGNTCLASLFLLCRIILATRIHSLFYFRHDVLNFTKSPLRLWLEFCCISRPNWNNFIFIILNFHIRIMGTSPSIEVFFDALHEFCISFHKSSAHLRPEYFKESFIGFVIIAKIRIFFPCYTFSPIILHKEGYSLKYSDYILQLCCTFYVYKLF